MKLGLATVAYREERFLPKFIQANQDRVDEILVLNSSQPWYGENDEPDTSAAIADSLGATVIRFNWPDEHSQRNAGQEYFSDVDWVVWLDPDEYLLDDAWDRLTQFLAVAEAPAYVCERQHTYWKRGYVIDPPEDYKQIIAARPGVRFFDKRCVNAPWGHAPVDLHHFSWARTDAECWRKISHYGHAQDFDTYKWFSEVWLDHGRLTDLHPLTPASLERAVPVILPEELQRLDLWP